MQLEPGMRVRCVDIDGMSAYLTLGKEYTVEVPSKSSFGSYVTMRNTEGRFRAGRFKPIFRVKMGRRWVGYSGCCQRTVIQRCVGCPYE